MAQRHAQPLLPSLNLQPSARLTFCIAALHLAAAISLAPLTIPLWLKLLPLPFIACSAWMTLRRHALLLSADAITSINSLPGGLLECTRRDGSRLRLRVLRDSSSVFESVVVLLLAPEAGGRLLRLVIFADALSADEMRRLRIWLRWSVAGANAP